MCGAACGEHIARAGLRSNGWDRAGAETLQGLPRCSAGLPVRSEARREPIETLGRRQVGRLRPMCEARERRPGEILAKVRCRETLEGRNPREHPAVGVLITRSVVRDSRKGQSPGTAAYWAGLPLRRREYR
jgi:hypothetical protein